MSGVDDAMAMSSGNEDASGADGILAASVMARARVTVDPAVDGWLRAELAAVVGREVSAYSEAANGAGSAVIHIGPGLPSEIGRPIAWLHSTNAGMDTILRDSRWRASTLLTRTVGRMDRRIAEYVLAWILADCQCIAEYTEQSRAEIWQRQPLRLIAGDLALVFGAGRMGSAVARLLRACDVRVVGVATTRRSSESFDDVVDDNGIAQLIPQARWLISTLPLTVKTECFFDDGIFRLAAGAYFINVGRAATVVPEALRRALEIGSLRRTLLDVLAEEPAPPGSEWWKLPNTILTPHTAGVTDPADVLMDFRSCWEMMQQGQRPELVVDVSRGY